MHSELHARWLSVHSQILSLKSYAVWVCTSSSFSSPCFHFPHYPSWLMSSWISSSWIKPLLIADHWCNCSISPVWCQASRAGGWHSDSCLEQKQTPSRYLDLLPEAFHSCPHISLSAPHRWCEPLALSNELLDADMIPSVTAARLWNFPSVFNCLSTVWVKGIPDGFLYFINYLNCDSLLSLVSPYFL